MPRPIAAKRKRPSPVGRSAHPACRIGTRVGACGGQKRVELFLACGVSAPVPTASNPCKTRRELRSCGGNRVRCTSLHKYAYVHGDPVQGIDPSGRSLVGVSVSIGTKLFVAVNYLTLAYGAAKIGYTIGTVISGLFITRSMTWWEAGGHMKDVVWEMFWVALGLVGINQATLRGTSWIVRLRHTKLLNTLANNARGSRQVRGAASFIQGRIAELYVAQKYVMWRNTANVGRRIPDFIGRTVIREVKNVANLQASSWRQLSVFANRALRDGKEFIIHVRPGTTISPTVIRNLQNLQARGLAYRIVRDIPDALRVL